MRGLQHLQTSIQTTSTLSAKISNVAFCITEDENGGVDLEEVLVLHQRQLMNYTIYSALKGGKKDDESEVKEYAGFVGKKCAKSILLFRK